MKIKIFISIILSLTLASCDNARTQDKPKQSMPKALEDNSTDEGLSYKLSSERGNQDLVESLYKELVSKNISLKKLEDQINELNENERDTTQLFHKFNEKNQSYFSSANGHIANIKDSLLKNKMRNLLADNLIKYNTSTAKYNEFLKIIQNKKLTINDLHILIKIIKTLPLIEKYQKDNLPNTKPFQDFINKQNETIKYADTLSK